MTFTGTISLRQSYWVLIKGTQKDAEHLSVVLRVEDDFVEVVYGQSRQFKDGNEEAVPYNASTKRLGITGDTHFWCVNVVLVARNHFLRWAGVCPNKEYLRLTALAERARRDDLVKDQRPPAPPLAATAAEIEPERRESE